MTGIDYYELLALAQVNEFLNKPLAQGSRESEQLISRVEMLQAAEKVLTTVLHFHESAQQRGQRQADAQHCLRAERTPDPMANLP